MVGVVLRATLWSRGLCLRLNNSLRSPASSYASSSTSSSLPTQPTGGPDSAVEENGGLQRNVLLKTPKGMRDSDPARMDAINRVVDTATRCFRRHGARPIDTPVMERKEILTGLYGEESHLIYELQDQGGEHLALRYDLTVPFARYLASGKIRSMKRYQVGRVYRRDNPSIAQGRLREFWQCDFDIAGHCEPMVADAECIRVVHEILTELGVGDFTIRVSERRLLHSVLAACGLPPSLTRGATAAIDKLDKESWASVRDELVAVRGLDTVTADRVGDYVRRSGGEELVESLLLDASLCSLPQAALALRDLQLLLRYLRLMGAAHRVRVDLSLARGLDYYTGVIYEAGLHSTTTGERVGSVAAGGRYDHLVAALCRVSVPCVGLSLGLDRIVAAMATRSTQSPPVQVLVASPQRGFLERRVELVTQLWDADIKAETPMTRDPRLLQCVRRCEELGVPLVAIVGAREDEGGTVTLRDVPTRDEVSVPRGEIITEIRRRLGRRDPS